MKNNEKTFKFPLSKSEEPLPCPQMSLLHMSAAVVGFPNLISPEKRRNEINY